MKRITKVITKALRAPLLHFSILGVLVLLLSASWRTPLGITLNSHQLDAMVNQTQGVPVPGKVRDRSVLKRRSLEEEVLFKEALKSRFDRLPAVQQRLRMLNDFLSTPDIGFGGYLALGMHEKDPVIRRYMISAMREWLKSRLAVAPADDAIIRKYYLANLSRFREPKRLRFTHLYVAGQDVQAQQRAQRLTEKLLAPDLLGSLEGLGDAFYNGHRFALSSERQIARKFGASFSREVFALPVRQWSAPIASAYGWHLVWIEVLELPQQRRLRDVRSIIQRELFKERQAEALSQEMQTLAQNYQLGEMLD